MVFSPKKILLCIYCSKNAKKHILKMDFQPKIVNFQMVFNLVDTHKYHSTPKKIITKLHP